MYNPTRSIRIIFALALISFVSFASYAGRNTPITSFSAISEYVGWSQNYGLLPLEPAPLLPPSGGYTRSSFTGTYTPITVGGGATQIVGGTTPTTFSLNSGTSDIDDGTAMIPLPFNFSFASTSYTGGSNFIGINTNGMAYLSTTGTNGSKLTSSNALANVQLFTSTAPNSTLAPYWDDLNLATVNGVTGTVLYQTTGSPGSRVLTVQWGNYPSYFNGSARALNFQLKIYEGTNVIEFWYGSVADGTVVGGNTSESASIGIEDGTGGNDRYIDALTGSSLTNQSIMNSGRFPKYNFRFTPGAPTPIAAGTYSVGVGQTYPNLSEAVADLNHRGVSGAVTLDLVDAIYDATPANGNNIFPIILGPISGASSTNTVTVIKSGAPASINSNIHSPITGTNGTIGTQDNSAIVTNTQEPIIGVVGSDYLTLRNLSFTTIAGTGGADVALGVFNSSATDGATNNTFRDLSFALSRTNTNSRAILQAVPSTPTSSLGTNSFNKYYNLAVENVYAGIQLNGSATNVDTGNEIGVTGSVLFNTIGGISANDIGNGTIQTWGIRTLNQSSAKIFSNEIRNVSANGPLTDGILVDTFQGNSEVYGNRVFNIRGTSTSSTTGIAGIRATHSTSGTHNIKIYNNFVHSITSAYTGSVSATRQIKGISAAGTGGSTAQSYDIDFNTVRIDGSGSPNISSVCFENATTSGPIYRVRNNIFANVTGAQTGVARHTTWRTPAGSSIGNTGSISNYNDLYIANPANGPVGIANATDHALLSNWQTAVSQDANSQSVDPIFVSSTDLHIQSSSPIEGDGLSIAGITTDIDGDARGAAPDIGADEITVSGSGTVQFSSATYDAAEGDNATITVTRVGGVTGDISVNFATSNGTATAGTCGTHDYVSAGGTLSWLDGESGSKTFNVQLCVDPPVEITETVNLALSDPVGATIGSQATATLNIADNPPGTIQFSSATYAGDEGTSVVVVATRTGGTGGAVSVDYATINGTALSGVCGSGGDYVTASGTLNWANGDSANKTFMVQTCSDFLYSEGSETLDLGLSNVTGSASIGTASAVLTINDLGTSFCNNADISIPSSGPASVYPSSINASSIPGLVNSVKVRLTTIQHSWSSDVRVLLVSPSGEKMVVMAGVGGNAGFDTPATITISDTGIATMPLGNTAIPTGTYKPTGSGGTYPSPAPAGPYPSSPATLNETFANADPNGDWSLFIVDAESGDSGSVSGGWCVELTTVPDHTLSVVSTTGGTISVPSGGTKSVGEGLSTPITAVADPGYTFTGWTLTSGTGTTITDPSLLGTTVVMGTTDSIVQANFVPNQYTVTFDGNNSDGGTMSPQVANAATNLTTNNFTRIGYTFAGWGTAPGGPVVYADGASYPFTADVTLYAQWTLNNYTLTVNNDGNGTTFPAGPGTVPHGAAAPLSANPASGYSFVNWTVTAGTGVLFSNANSPTSTVTLTDGNATIQANFAINTYTLIYNSGAGGTILGTTPQTVNHGASGSAVTAVPNSGFAFVNWSDSSTANPRTDTNVTGPITVTANFVATYTLSVATVGSGSVVKDPDQPTYVDGTEVELTAIPSVGWTFNGWSGDTEGADPDIVPLVIITGESNSGGYAVNADATPTELSARPGVQILNNNTLLFEDLDIGTNNLIGHAGLSENATHGFELGLANSVAASEWPNSPVYLVKAGQ
ncbi:MAG: InlB B-repeat-containing protein, partial [Blastocatellia bacterium]|nr:InlB B-repeat-containing protein [Blastocatellia bacterium]